MGQLDIFSVDISESADIGLIPQRYWRVNHHGSQCSSNSRLQITQVITRSGQITVKFQCSDCGNVGPPIAKQYIERLCLDEVPVIRDNRTMQACERCGSLDGVECHHYAPVDAFGWDEAERYATGWLCPDCHRQWHIVMRRWATNTGRR